MALACSTYLPLKKPVNDSLCATLSPVKLLQLRLKPESPLASFHQQMTGCLQRRPLALKTQLTEEASWTRGEVYQPHASVHENKDKLQTGKTTKPQKQQRVKTQTLLLRPSAPSNVTQRRAEDHKLSAKLWVQLPAQGHFAMQKKEQQINTPTFWLADDPLYPLRH
ncbi:unnamed protein product [Pleuronectes platessa]|uniref:Uncharacterized protein n=1 Tax=Pleuronectes platessa TaxID=8262 RepID=A0A9N7VFQ3_PLEPL|nr:unnamed protein product [Pleuronectes platessa]